MKQPSLIFSKRQRIGIICLLLMILVIQGVFYIYLRSSAYTVSEKVEYADASWLMYQGVIDSLKKEQAKHKNKIFPFNPNFISEYTGARLGMSTEELDRLYVFRSQNKFVNSPSEFQKVTGVSDSLLAVIKPYFKFPDWVSKSSSRRRVLSNSSINLIENSRSIQDINTTTREHLMGIRGIGPVLSERIIQYRDKLGGFVSMEQLKEVWGLSEDVLLLLNKGYRVDGIPESLNKIEINNASLKELASFPYFNYSIAKEIVAYRSMNRMIQNAEDLTKIKGLSEEKISFIALYLVF